MNGNHIPVNAYIFIGLASVVMAVVTVMDSNGGDTSDKIASNESSSVTNMLPSFSNPFSSTAIEGQPDNQEKNDGNTFNNIFNSDNKAGENQPPVEPNPENNDNFNSFGNSENTDMFDDNANSEQGLMNEMPPEEEESYDQNYEPQRETVGGKKYNKSHKHKSKRNKKTKNHRKK